jgi:hypothetical protein
MVILGGSSRYFINYATADALCDEFVKHPGQLLNLHTLHGAHANPGGQDLLHTHGHDFWFSTPTSALPDGPCSLRN